MKRAETTLSQGFVMPVKERPRTLVADMGFKGFEECLAIQRRIHEARREGVLPDCLILVEHPPTLTMGRRGRRENLLVSESDLESRGISIAAIERGGDWTYHGPGQLVGYPIFRMGRVGVGVLDFVERLEEVMIRVLEDFRITGKRDERNRGVWIENRKVGFIGIAVSRGISLHGFALNVNPSLSPFEMILPCGLKGVEVTSMKECCNREIPLEKVKERTVAHFEKIFHRSMERIEPAVLLNWPGLFPSMVGTISGASL